MNSEFNFFNNIGVLTHKFTDLELNRIRNEVYSIKDNFELNSNRKTNYDLAGNIYREYSLVDTRDTIDALVLPLIKKYNETYNYEKLIITCGNNLPEVTLGKTWINYQKKYEFNPIHSHPGVYGFVIYLDIPYKLEDEYKLSPGKEGNANLAGQFQFIYTNALGQISTQSIPTDKRMQNVCMIFPAGLSHCVYPFYSSDDYRISVAGNYIPV